MLILLIAIGFVYNLKINCQVQHLDSTKIFLKDYIDSVCLCSKFDTGLKNEKVETFKIVEEPAIYPKGDLNDFRIYIQKCINQPTDNEDHKNDRVILGFSIDNDGLLVDSRILRCNNPTLAREALRCLNNSPKWIPAKVNGKNVKQQLTIAIVYDIKK